MDDAHEGPTCNFRKEMIRLVGTRWQSAQRARLRTSLRTVVRWLLCTAEVTPAWMNKKFYCNIKNRNKMGRKGLKKNIALETWGFHAKLYRSLISENEQITPMEITSNQRFILIDEPNFAWIFLKAVLRFISLVSIVYELLSCYFFHIYKIRKPCRAAHIRS